MQRLAASIALISLTVSVVQASAKEEKIHRLTEKQFGEVIVAQDGDLVDLWLPNSMPFLWVLSEDHPLLKRQKLTPKELEEIRKEERGPDKRPVAGRPGHFAGRFKVQAKEELTTVVKWTYCNFGDLAATEKELKSGQIPKAPEFRPELKTEEFRPGMVYQVTIQAHPR
jgi:hypothetical protein